MDVAYRADTRLANSIFADETLHQINCNIKVLIIKVLIVDFHLRLNVRSKYVYF